MQRRCLNNMRFMHPCQWTRLHDQIIRIDFRFQAPHNETKSTTLQAFPVLASVMHESQIVVALGILSLSLAASYLRCVDDLLRFSRRLERRSSRAVNEMASRFFRNAMHMTSATIAWHNATNTKTRGTGRIFVAKFQSATRQNYQSSLGDFFVA